jgi:hypothetical protein
LEIRHSGRREDAIYELIEDDAIDRVAFGRVRAHTLQAARCQLLRVDITIDEWASSG